MNKSDNSGKSIKTEPLPTCEINTLKVEAVRRGISLRKYAAIILSNTAKKLNAK